MGRRGPCPYTLVLVGGLWSTADVEQALTDTARELLLSGGRKCLKTTKLGVKAQRDRWRLATTSGQGQESPLPSLSFGHMIPARLHLRTLALVCTANTQADRPSTATVRSPSPFPTMPPVPGRAHSEAASGFASVGPRVHLGGFDAGAFVLRRVTGGGGGPPLSAGGAHPRTAFPGTSASHLQALWLTQTRAWLRK
ncbi:hypothetical protein SKAU_G00199930 [Synaphobranchus kaupii]|uniref:Uncharacterized protein n=1 Tax=Synaphobranchus kaupii TaxID=118154 RepID=A0A9Q1FFA9_SYNKA|nr:hypothetical protein SKAU_G00199930 [Synaphobranchus kaupii]